MKRVLLMTSLAIAAVFVSCKKNMETDDTVKLLKAITYSDSDGYEFDNYKFEYDELNRITKMSCYYYEGDLSYSYTLTYAEDDLVQVLYSYSNGNVETYEYTKSGNTIAQKHGVETSTIELNSDGLPIKLESEKDEYGNTFVEIYKYLDGNLTEYQKTSILPQWDHTESRTDSYVYDNKKGALYHCNTPKWWLILNLNYFGIKNNRIDAHEPPRSFTEYTYEFDGAGFPTKRRCKNTWGMVGHVKEWVEVFTYIKK